MAESPRRPQRGGGKAQARDAEHYTDPLLDRTVTRNSRALRERHGLLPKSMLARLMVAALVLLFLLLLIASVRAPGLIH